MLRPACLNRVRLRADAHNQIPLQRFCTKRLRPCYNQNVVQSLPLRKRTSVVRPAAVALTAGAPVPSPRTKALPFLSTRFDEEVLAIAVPALASMLLEPVMGVFNSGGFVTTLKAHAPSTFNPLHAPRIAWLGHAVDVVGTMCAHRHTPAT